MQSFNTEACGLLNGTPVKQRAHTGNDLISSSSKLASTTKSHLPCTLKPWCLRVISSECGGVQEIQKLMTTESVLLLLLLQMTLWLILVCVCLNMDRKKRCPGRIIISWPPTASLRQRRPTTRLLGKVSLLCLHRPNSDVACEKNQTNTQCFILKLVSYHLIVCGGCFLPAKHHWWVWIFCNWDIPLKGSLICVWQERHHFITAYRRSHANIANALPKAPL